MLRDQLVENVNSHGIRERLLLEIDLTLNKAITIATQMEAAAEQAKMISNQTSVPEIQATGVPTVDRYKRKSSKFSATSSTRACYRCGSIEHLANDSRCPAVSVKCNNCQKFGHFSRVCRSTQTRSVREIELPELQILYMHDSVSNKIVYCYYYD